MPKTRNIHSVRIHVFEQLQMNSGHALLNPKDKARGKDAMKRTGCRAISHWFTWNDLDYPRREVERKIDRSAFDASTAGVNLAMVFGFHFRWDFIYCFDTLHKLLKYTVDAYHRHGIKVMDHHSAVLTHRPRNWDGRIDTSIRNHHHVPFTPTPEIIPFLQYEGSCLNSWRQKRVDDMEPVFLPRYQAESFCVNNPDFRRAYLSYVKRLFAETGIDGLMCDDVIYYRHWGACGCPYCRNKFGSPLPPSDDADFWGNYQNAQWRKWVRMRYHDSADFLRLVREATGPDALLTTCCSSSVSKALDACGMDMKLMNPPLSMTMLEMCGEIAGGKAALTARIPDILLHKAISERRQIGCLGLGYAFYPDSAFLVWSLNKFFGADCWISALKGRLGISERAAGMLPVEPELVREAYDFESRYPQLFNGESVAEVAVYYSNSSKVFNGDCADDYCNGFAELLKSLFLHDIPATVVDEIPPAGRYPLLVLGDCGCLSSDLRKSLTAYLEQGGKILAAGLLGSFDETGRKGTTPFLVKYETPPADRKNQKTNTFFEPWGHVPKRDIPERIPDVEPGWREMKLGCGTLYWNPIRLHLARYREIMLEKRRTLVPSGIQIEKPENLNCRIFGSGNARIIHYMPSGMKAVFHAKLKNQITGERVVKSIRYSDLEGEVRIQGKYASAVLYSADLPALRRLKPDTGGVTVPLIGLRRFFTVELFPRDL